MRKTHGQASGGIGEVQGTATRGSTSESSMLCSAETEARMVQGRFVNIGVCTSPRVISKVSWNKLQIASRMSCCWSPCYVESQSAAQRPHTRCIIESQLIADDLRCRACTFKVLLVSATPTASNFRRYVRSVDGEDGSAVVLQSIHRLPPTCIKRRLELPPADRNTVNRRLRTRIKLTL